MKEIILTRSQVALVDDEDFSRVNALKWQTSVSRGQITKAAHAYRREDGRVNLLPMHDFILGRRDGLEIDHINLNPLDNRRCNLRYATRQQNQCNRRMNSRNKLGIKGVSRVPSGRFHATISVFTKAYFLGSFATAEEASAAYRNAAKQYHGEFARA